MIGLLKSVGLAQPEATETSNFGINRFKEDDDGPNKDNVTFESPFEVGRKLANQISVELVNTLKQAKDKVTPGFIHRYKNKKIHVKMITSAERYSTKF